MLIALFNNIDTLIVGTVYSSFVLWVGMRFERWYGPIRARRAGKGPGA